MACRGWVPGTSVEAMADKRWSPGVAGMGEVAIRIQWPRLPKQEIKSQGRIHNTGRTHEDGHAVNLQVGRQRSMQINI